MSKKSAIRRFWQRLRTVPGLGKYSAVLTVLIVLGLAATWFLLGNLKFIMPGSDRFEFSADFDKASAVEPSQRPSVRIAGVPVGVVTDSEVSSEGNTRLSFSLEPDQEIYDNAKIIIRPKSPLNEMYVNIEPGGPPGRPIKAGESMPATHTDRPVQPDEVLSHLDSRARNAVTNLLVTSDTGLASAPESLPAGLNATNDALRAFRPVFDKLEGRREYIRNLVSSLSQITAAVGDNNGRLTQLMDSLDGTLQTLTKRDNELRKTLAELPGTTDSLSNAMTNVNGLGGELDPALSKISQASEGLPETIKGTDQTLADARQTVDAAKPVVSKAEPLLDHLSPVVRDVHGSLDYLEPVSKQLDPVTAKVVPHLGDLAGFIYNTSSMFSLRDDQGSFARGHVVLPLPDAGVITGPHNGIPGPDAPTPGIGGGN